MKSFSIWPIDVVDIFIDKILNVVGRNNFHFVQFDNLRDDDFVFVFGGDGTFLKFLNQNHKKSWKLIFINQGKVGFLSSLEESQLDNLDLNKEFFDVSYLKINTQSKKYIAFNESKLFLDKLADFEIKINEVKIMDSLSSELIFINYIGTTGLARSYRYPMILRDYPMYIFDILDSPQYRYNPNLNQPILLSKNHCLEIVFNENQNMMIKNDNKKNCLNEVGKITISQHKTKCKVLEFNNLDHFSKMFKKLF